MLLLALLPSLASDKCKGESECLSFDQHMQAVNASWAKHELANGVSSQDISVVFTTESKAMVQEQKDFASNTTLRSRYPLSFNFVTNTKDVTPGTLLYPVSTQTQVRMESTHSRTHLLLGENRYGLYQRSRQEHGGRLHVIVHYIFQSPAVASRIDWQLL